MGNPFICNAIFQQLQQPIPPPRPPIPQSPRQQPQSSPRMTSPRQPPAASPQPQIVRPTNLQQQLMQPTKSQSVVSVPVPVQELNTMHNGTSNNHNGNNMVSLQNLLQSGMAVQVSQHQTQTSNSIPVQLNISGLPSPVTLSFNVDQTQQQKMVPTSSMVTVASAAAASTGGTGNYLTSKNWYISSNRLLTCTLPS